MTAFLHDNVLDQGVKYVDDHLTGLYICSQQPTTYTEAITTYALGNKASPACGVPEDDTSGRKVTISAITDGSVTATGTASHYALVNSASTELMVAQALASSQAVTNGNTFTLAAFKVAIPDPTA